MTFPTSRTQQGGIYMVRSAASDYYFSDRVEFTVESGLLNNTALTLSLCLKRLALFTFIPRFSKEQNCIPTRALAVHTCLAI